MVGWRRVPDQKKLIRIKKKFNHPRIKKKLKQDQKKLCVYVLVYTVNAASPSCFNCTGCSRRVTAAVARCIVFPDVLSFTEDSSAARVRGRDSCPKRASTSRKVHSCWSSSTCWEATSSWSPLCLNPANIWGAGPSRGLLSLSQYFRETFR